MTKLAQYHMSLGARLAADQIPLDYGEQAAEYGAADTSAILLDRSHEGRILLQGRDRFELVNRMSTNDVSQLEPNHGKATVFINANARILFRVSCFNLPGGLLLISEGGQGPALANYLRRNIFFGDQATVTDISADTVHFALHGKRAAAIMMDFAPEAEPIPPLGGVDIESEFGNLIIARRKPISGSHWVLIAEGGAGVSLHRRLRECGACAGLLPAGSLAYNSLRIRSGRPAGIELSSDYIPLEVGLWDEISFSKGCYTGQEIIARLESRERLAKTLVKLDLSSMVPAPAPVHAMEKFVGTLTSSVLVPDGRVYALAVLKTGSALPGTDLSVGAGSASARVVGYAGIPPPFISPSGAAAGGH